jgi:hypothetical protein
MGYHPWISVPYIKAVERALSTQRLDQLDSYIASRVGAWIQVLHDRCVGRHIASLVTYEISSHPDRHMAECAADQGRVEYRVYPSSKLWKWAAARCRRFSLKTIDAAVVALAAHEVRHSIQHFCKEIVPFTEDGVEPDLRVRWVQAMVGRELKSTKEYLVENGKDLTYVELRTGCREYDATVIDCLVALRFGRCSTIEQLAELVMMPSAALEIEGI